MAKKVKRTKRKGNKTKSSRRSNPPSTFNSVPDVTFESEPPLQRATPIQASVLSQVAPFRIPRCVASVLTGARPSQKITARAVASALLPTTGSLIFNISPCIASDFTSMMCLGYTGAGTAQMWAAALNPANTKLTASTNTPYTSSTLSSGDYKWRLVSSGVRLRNTTAPVQRQGVVRYLVDYGHDLLDYANLDAVSVSGIAADIAANHKTVRVNSSTNPTIEIATHTLRDGEWVASADGMFYNRASPELNSASGEAFYSGPVWISITAASSQQTYDIELIEHWEIAGSAIETLHTPSPTHSMAAQTIKSIAEHSHHQHSMQPHVSFASVVKGAVRLEHNKEAMRDASIVGTALALL